MMRIISPMYVVYYTVDQLQILIEDIDCSWHASFPIANEISGNSAGLSLELWPRKCCSAAACHAWGHQLFPNLVLKSFEI